MPASSSAGREQRHTFQVRRLARQSMMLLSSGVVSYVGALALQVVLARSLGKTGFGAWAVAFSIALTVSSIGLGGADWILIRYGSHFHGIDDLRRLRKTVHLALILGGATLVAIGLGLFLAAPLIAERVFHRPGATSILQLAGVLVPVQGVGQILLNGTRAFKSVRELVLISNILQPAVRLVVVGAALLLYESRDSAFLGLVVAEVVLTGVTAVALARRLPFRGPTAPIQVGEMVRFGLPSWGTRLIENGRTQMFPVLLGSIQNFSASGVFVASQRVARAPAAVVNSLLKVYSPIGSDLYMQGRRDELRVLFQNVGKWSFALAFPLSCFLVVFPGEVLTIFGKGFADASTTLQILAFAILFNFGTGPVTVTLVMCGRPRLAFVDYVVALVAEVVLVVVLVPSMGVLGAAIAKLVGTAANNLLPLAQVWRLERLGPYRRDYWKPLAAGVGSVLFAKGVVVLLSLGDGVVAAAAAAAATGVAYVGLVLLFRLSHEDRTALDTLLRRGRGRRARDDGAEPDGSPGPGPEDAPSPLPVASLD